MNSLGLRFLLAVSFCTASASDARARCAPRATDQVIYAIDCQTPPAPPAPRTTTAGIQEAIDACGPGYTSGRGCVVVLPRGDLTITEGITVGTLGSTKEGVTLRGHGSGTITTSPRGIPSGGTNIQWNARGGVMLTLRGVRSLRLEDFTLNGDLGSDGTNVASKLIEVHGDIASNEITSQLIFENLVLVGTPAPVQKPLGIDLVGRASGGTDDPHDQIDRVVVRNSIIGNVNRCLRMNSNQSLLNRFENVNCGNYTSYGIDVRAGSIEVLDSVFAVGLGSGAIAAIRWFMPGGAYNSTPLYQNVERNHFEIGAGSAIVSTAPAGVTSGYHTRIVGNDFVLQYPDPAPNDESEDADLINLQGRGQVLIEGNTFQWTDAGWTGVGADIVVSSSQDPSMVTALANQNRNLANLDWEIGGATTLFCPYADATASFDDRDCDKLRDPGEPYYSGASNSVRHGTTRWGLSDGAAWDTGTEVCADADLLCASVTELPVSAVPIPRGCQYRHPALTRFLAFCR